MKGYLKNEAATAKTLVGRLVPVRRPRGLASRRGDRDQGPLQGHHHFRRREHLEPRGRGSADPASGRDAGGRRGAARSRNGARRPAHLSNSSRALRSPMMPRSLPSARAGWPVSRSPRRWCSARCPRHRRARFRNSCCEIRRNPWRRRDDRRKDQADRPHRLSHRILQVADDLQSLVRGAEDQRGRDPDGLQERGLRLVPEAGVPADQRAMAR